jgi:hypothetical protein
VGTEAETDEVFFERKIRPVLLEHCVSCHGPEKQKGHLRLDTPEGIRAGGETGAIFEAGDPEKSRMIRAVRYLDEDLKMPPKKRLSDAQVEDLARWVKGGAAMPAGRSLGHEPSSSQGIPNRRTGPTTLGLPAAPPSHHAAPRTASRCIRSMPSSGLRSKAAA